MTEGMTQMPPKEQYAHLCTAAGCHANTQLMKDLPNTVEGLGTLRKLDLSRSMLRRTDVEPLVQAILRHCRSLQVLNLSHNYLTDDSVIQICETLVENSPMLETLDLSDNPLSNKTGRYLARFVYSMPSLKNIKVQKTLMSENILLAPSSISKPQQSSVHKTQTTTTTMVSSTRDDNFGNMAKGCVSSVHDCTREDGRVKSTKQQWAALKTLWRAATLAAPHSDNYSALATLISMTQEDDDDTTQVQQNIFTTIRCAQRHQF
ncbi:putative calpain-like cysteine peptidase [Trypanosoma theileri]|uniref:Putative calpain-like cysteine peptidase n=1 Tax=Trypanosoma theileri TaxID=67003 RepID=A0A1X0P1E0_9TRYP|nr:putative calpain-like cysteine peptidase [Trypanosoma theileri]ORC90766.1 putative calpain-like cysteine peptidase [Trypanosoma theileri]